MRFYWHLFWGYLAQYLKGRLIYRWDFLTGVISDMVYQSVALVFLLVIFEHIPRLAGWRQEEVFFIYGYFLWPYSFFASIGAGMWEFADRYIVRGELDRLLVRPANVLFQVVLEALDLSPLMGLVTGTAIMFWSAQGMDLRWQWYDPLLFLVLTCSAVLVYFGVYFSLACISFWYDGRTGILPLTWNLNNYGRYPVSIYNRALRILLTWVLPFSFVGFYPAAVFLRRETYYMWAFITPVVGIAALWIAYQIWKAGVRRYHSTGS